MFHTSVAVPKLPQDKVIRVPFVQRTPCDGLFEYFQAVISQMLIGLITDLSFPVKNYFFLSCPEWSVAC